MILHFFPLHILTMHLSTRRLFFFLLSLLLLFNGFSSAAASIPPAKILGGFVSNAVTRLMKWAWSLKSTTKTAISGRPMMKFESGYTVETVFDGSKLGIEPYSVEVLPSDELLILDSANSNLYRISSSLSQYTRPKLVAGSAEGYSGHVDGKLREARMNHPKGIAVDDRGNVYVADTMNMAIRKISDAGVTTIAGGVRSRGGGHVDGPSEEAKFSNDFDVVYVGSSCSLLVIDRGNRAIREIQLHFDDCAYQYETGFPLGVAVLLAAGFFGYMLALLQRRVGSLVSSQNELSTEAANIAPIPYQKPLKSVRPPLIPIDDESEKQEEGFFGSLAKLLIDAASSASEIFKGIFPSLRKNPPLLYQHLNQPHYNHQPHTWPTQESIEVPKEDEPPPVDTRAPTPRKTYPFMSKDADKMQHHFRQSRAFYTELQQQQQQQQHHHHQQQQQQRYQHQNQHRQHSSGPRTVYEPSCERTKEIVFGAVQEEGWCEPVVKPTRYADSSYDGQSARFRMGYDYNRFY